MGVFDNIKIPTYGAAPSDGSAAPAPTSTPSTGGVFDNIKIPDYSAVKSAGTFDNVKVPASSPYFYGPTANGGVVGKSDALDISGKPFVGYRNPGDTSTTTDKTRLATTFDPTKPTKLDYGTFQEARMPSGAASKLKQQLGGAYSDELDHKIAIALSGSNALDNLQIQPGRMNGGAAAQSDKIETQLAKDVAGGKKSLFDAQTELAKAKGISTPWTGGTTPNVLEQNPPPFEFKPDNNPGMGSLFALGNKSPTSETSKTLDKNDPADTINLLKILFVNKNEVRAPFARADQTDQLAGGKLVSMTADLGGRLFEFIPRAVARFVSNINTSKGKETPTSFDASRLGFEPGMKIPDSGKSYIDALQKTDYYNDPSFKNLPQAVIAGIVTGGFDVIDAVGAGDVFKSIAQSVIKNVAVPAEEQAVAWRALGRPADEAEAKANYRALANEFHPDKPTGNAEIFKRVNDAYQVISEQGIPKDPGIIARSARNVARFIDSDLPTVLRQGLGEDVQAPYAAVKGQLPGYKSAETSAPLGASIERVEPVGFGGNPKPSPEIVKARAPQLDVIAGNLDDAIYALEGGAQLDKVIHGQDLLDVLKSYRDMSNTNWHNMSDEQFRELSETMKQAGFDPSRITPPVEVSKELQPLATSAQKYPTVDAFKQNLTAPNLRRFLNNVGGEGAMTASSRATGAKTKLTGDYLYRQDRGAFDALHDDIKMGRNINDPIIKKLTDFYSNARGLGRIQDKTPIFSKQSGPLVSIEEAKQKIFSTIPPKDVRLIFTDKLMERGSTGRYIPSVNPVLKPIIKLYEEGGKVEVKTAYHEAYHYLFNNAFTAPERSEALALAEKEIGLMNKGKYHLSGYRGKQNVLEEYLADKFADFKANQDGYKGPLRKFFDKLNELLKKISDTIKKVIEDHKATPNKQGGFAKNPFAGEENAAEITSPESTHTASLDNQLTDLETQKTALKEVIDQSPAKSLAKYADRNGELPEVLGGNTSKFGRMGDDVASQLGFKDSETARTEYENYKLLKRRYEDISKNIDDVKKIARQAKLEDKDAKSLNWFLNRAAKRAEKEIGEALRARRISQSQGKLRGKTTAQPILAHASNLATPESHISYNDDITTRNGGVKPPTVRGGMTSPEFDLTKWKDKPAAFLSRDTMERNLEKVAGPEGDKVNNFLVDPIRTNETNRVKFVNQERIELRKSMKDLGVKLNSQADKIGHMYGEGRITETQFTDLIPDPKIRGNIMKAIGIARGKYDTWLNMINLEREMFGYKPIAKRPNYLRHFRQLNDFIKEFGILFRGSDLPTEISGITDTFNPGKPFTNAEIRRLGNKTTFSLVGGMDNYLDSVSRQMFHTDSVQRGRALEKYIREVAKATSGNPEETARIALPNFVANLNEYTNLVSGKAARFDRALESIVGRGVINALNSVTKRFGANEIAANISSALTHGIPAAFNLATVSKVGATRGTIDTLLSPLSKGAFTTVDGVESKFLIRRYPEQQIFRNVFQKTTKSLGLLFETMDRFISRLAVTSKYYEELGTGLSKEEAMRSADNYANRVIGDRSIGNLPNVMNTRTLRFLTQFQVEINDNLSVLIHDVPKWSKGNKLKIAGMLFQFLVFIHFFNYATKKIKGSGKGFDPIGLGLTLAGMDDGSVPFVPVRKEGSSLKTNIKNFAQDLTGELPFSGLLTGQTGVGSGLPDIYGLATGQSSLTTEAKQLLYDFLSPVGGGIQTKKTIEGIQAYNKGGTFTSSGKPKTTIEKTPTNFTKAVLFGPSSVSKPKANASAAKSILDKYGIKGSKSTNARDILSKYGIK